MRHHTLQASIRYGIGILAVAGAVGWTQPAARADSGSFTLRQPMNNATVRETVPLRVPRTLLRQAGYASISIDGQFRGAPAVPSSGDVVYEWDTKHGAAPQSDNGSGGNATADAPESPDGPHVVQVTLFDKDSNQIATATSTVRVLNHITTLPDGVRLIYKWRPDEVVTYRLHSVLKNQSSDSDSTDNGTAAAASGNPGAIQDVYARLQRSVEDVSGAGVLLRDHYAGGTFGSVPLTQAYTLSSKYITVNKSGSLLVENHPLGAGLHYGYGVDNFPDRRVGAGDSWQTQMMISLPWAVEHMTTVRGQARLDDFEWESNYPTAKIVETYTGPATFKMDNPTQSVGSGAPSLGYPGTPGSGLTGSTATNGSVQTPNLTVRRTIWFAYESGVVVREETTLSTPTTTLGSYLSSLSSPSSASSGAGAAYGYGSYGRRRGMGAPGGYPGVPGAPGAYGGPPPGSGAPYAPGPGAPMPPMPGAPGADVYSPYGGSAAAATPTNVESDKTLTLISVS